MIISKDTEIASQKAKLELQDGQLREAKAEVADQLEKLSEHQRTVVRLKESVREQQQQIESLSTELQTTQELYRSSRGEVEQLSTSLLESRHSVGDMSETHRRQLQELRLEYEQQLSSSRASISALELQIGNYASQLRLESDSADALENYKKRAQLALKVNPPLSLSLPLTHSAERMKCLV